METRIGYFTLLDIVLNNRVESLPQNAFDESCPREFEARKVLEFVESGKLCPEGSLALKEWLTRVYPSIYDKLESTEGYASRVMASEGARPMIRAYGPHLIGLNQGDRVVARVMTRKDAIALIAKSRKEKVMVIMNE